MDLAAESLAALWNDSAALVYPRVSPPQLTVLLTLERRGPARLTELAEELGAIPSSASRLCDRLEAAGLLVRGAGKNRREVRLELTSAGRALVEDVRKVRHGRLREVLEKMTPSGRAELLAGLREFHEIARNDSAIAADQESAEPTPTP